MAGAWGTTSCKPVPCSQVEEPGHPAASCPRRAARSAAARHAATTHCGACALGAYKINVADGVLLPHRCNTGC
jgi:hypothetical protein